MGKVLSWVVLGLLAWVVWKFIVVSQRKSARHEQGEAGDPPAGPPRVADRGELMVRCAHCGIYLPQSESLVAGGQRYCTAAHRLAGPRDDERSDTGPAS